MSTSYYYLKEPFTSANVRGLDPSLVLVSEYGELFTVAEIRAMAGRGKVAP